ncbi:GH23247, partial [Drosophila grimshawi]
PSYCVPRHRKDQQQQQQQQQQQKEIYKQEQEFEGTSKSRALETLFFLEAWAACVSHM